MSYIPPDEALSPRDHWKLFRVLLDQGESKNDEGRYSVAVGVWDGQVRLAMRWNGTKDDVIGNPQSRGYATWFIIPPDFNAAVMNKLPRTARATAELLLGRNPAE